MAAAIWKYDLKPSPIQFIEMPKGAYVLDVQEQHGVLRVWAQVDPYAPTEPRAFAIVGTGNGEPPSLETSRHIATVQVGQFVWHVYEPKEA